MKILFCTNKFEEVSNGPAKFANLLLAINDLYPEHDIRILTEDVIHPQNNVYRLNLKYPAALRIFSHYFRIQQYHQEAVRIRENDFPFDVIVYNNAFIGLRSVLTWREALGMVNDYNNACRSWAAFQFEYTFIKQFLFKQLERFTLKRQQFTIVNSIYLSKFLAKTYGIPREKFEVLYKAINKPSVINRTELDPSVPIRVLFVKADYILGGVFLLISALGRLPYSFRLTIIGPPMEAESEIRKQLQVYSNIDLDFKSYQRQENVFKEMLETHIYVSPSYREALGVANLEAMSHGVPVISTKVGGIPEVLDDGKCGWLVPSGNPKALAEAIIECIKNEKLRQEKVIAGLVHCQQFNKERVLNNFLKILSKVQAT